MPCFRGVEVSIVTEADPRALPEFPHPDGSSIVLLSPDRRTSPTHLSPAAAPLRSESDARLHKVKPSISVYIPSIAGTQFWLHYKIERIPQPTTILYFKMFMNARNVANWGVDLDEQLSGAVMRALYEPCQRWNYREKGSLYRQEGIEARTFHFSYNGERRSIAEDGGLIEVQVFRARSKRSRAAKLDAFREQDRYGISSPSCGLLDKPNEAVYFEFHLVDPRDSPFATFRFHYRSWKNLTELCLVAPVDILRHAALLRSLKLDATVIDAIERERAGNETTDEASPRKHRASAQFEFGFEPGPLPHIKENTRGCRSARARQPSTFPPRTSSRAIAPFPRQDSAMPQPLRITKSLTKSLPKNRLRTPPRVFSQPKIAERLRGLPQPSKMLRDRISEPVDWDEYDDDDDYDDDDIEYGVATEVAVPRDTSQSRLIDTTPDFRPLSPVAGSDSPSDYENSFSSDASTADYQYLFAAGGGQTALEYAHVAFSPVPRHAETDSLIDISALTLMGPEQTGPSTSRRLRPATPPMDAGPDDGSHR